MQVLSGLDASFLFLESSEVPMHIGGVAILEGSLEFSAFRQFIDERVHTVERLTEKLLSVPMSLDRPYWVTDEKFSLDRHVYRIALPQPGGWRELREVASRIFSQQMDRNYPLWEFVFVEGINGIAQVPEGSVAVISKLHHAGFDGKSGAQVMSMLFDVSPEPKPIPPMSKQLIKRKKSPNALSLVTGGAVKLLSRQKQLPGLLWETGKATLKAGYISKVHGIEMPTLPFVAPRTPFNDSVNAERTWNSAVLDLKRVKALRKVIPDCTLNDVILAICAGALRRYLLEKNQLPKKPLVAMVPVSVREDNQEAAMGNQVSAMYIQLATDEPDPIKRLETIHINTLVGKLYQEAVDAKSLMGYAEVIPFGLANVASRYYSRANLSKKHNPAFNVVITNVPGPQIPLFMAGKKLLLNMGTGPIYEGMGLIMPIFSYNGSISISPTSAKNIMPDMDNFTRYIRESANELEALVLERLEQAPADAPIDQYQED